jgi:predicted SprT family Zn-dependent metalloprotease
MMPDTNQPTRRQYGEFDAAYDFFNDRLFDGALPRCLITMQRKANAKGFFCGSRFASWDDTDVRDEIALNPAIFKSRTVEETLGTLVHEMVHLWQHHCGDPGRTGYHNKEWADRMEEIGLMPTSTGEPGGKRTGQRVTHYIIPDGPFSVACADLIASGATLPYVQRTDEQVASKKLASKTKFKCQECGAQAWGKPDLLLVCGSDGVVMVRA